MSIPDSPVHRSRAAYLSLRDQDLVVASMGGRLPGWSFFDHPRLVAVFEDALAALAPTSSGRRSFAARAGSFSLPELPAFESERGFHRALCAAAPAEFADDDPIVRVRADLGRLGRWLQWHARSSWSAETFSESAGRDAKAATLWAAWASGDCWSGRARWEKLYLKSAVAVFRSVAAARELPPDVTDRAVSDLREAFFFRMIGGEPAGWREVAARVLETAHPDPITSVHAALSPARRERAALCITCRGAWRTTVARVFDELAEPLARARVLSGAEHDVALPSWDALLDLHCALRLMRAWSRPEAASETHGRGKYPEGMDYAVLSQNRGRARGRLRAVLAGSDPGFILERVLALDALHARTEAALRRFAWAWAWQELAYDFSFDLHRAVTPACPPPATTIEAFAPHDRAALPTWVLLVVYRGRLEHLQKWVQTGSTGDRDSTWARLLTDALPDGLKDPPQPGARTASYHRLRAELAFSLNSILVRLRPRIAETAELPTGRSLKQAFLDLHTPDWNPAVPMLRSGFPTACKSSVLAISQLEALLEDPTDVQVHD